jgi:tetratricopeptide (TPR) repeat protein
MPNADVPNRKLGIVYRLLSALFITAAAFAQCRLPDVAPGALSRLSPSELVDSGHFLSAERILDPFVKSFPDNAPTAWLLSRAKGALGELDEAMSLAEAALAADPTNADYHVQAAAVAGRLAEKASLLKQLTYAKRARQELDAALALDPANTDAQWGLMMFFYAAPSLIGGDKNKAVHIGEKVGGSSPDTGRYYQGRLAVQMKDPEKAEAFFLESAIANPLSFDTSAALAKLYMEDRPDQARAEKWACQAVHTDPTRSDGWALLAKAHTMCGCWTEAIEIARRAGEIDGENQAAWYAIASVAVERGEQLEMAVDFLRKYLSQTVEGGQPSAAMAHMQLGLAFAKLGKPTDAIIELKTAIEQDAALDAAKAEIKRLNADMRR